jgi:hypothetical protein
MITSERRIGSRHGRTRSGPRAGFRPLPRSVGGPGAWPARRIYAGRRNALVAQRAFFSARRTHQMTMRARLEPWLGGAALVACAATWGLLLALMAA